MKNQTDANILINAKQSVRIPFLPLYIVLIVGRDRRSGNSEAESDRRLSRRLIQSIVFFLVFSWLIFCFLIGTGLTLYILKSHFQIDIFPGQHPVKEFFATLGLCA